MNKAKIRELRSAIADSLTRALGVDQNILFEVGNAKYTSDSVTFQLKCVETSGNPEASIGEIEFKRHCGMYGLSPEDYGKQFDGHGKILTVVGIAIKNRKYPIICEANGTRYKVEASRVRAGVAS